MSKAKYWDGSLNRLYRYWFYIKQGNNILNEFRNLFLIIIGTCWTFKEKYPILENLWFVSGVFVASLIILFIVGYLCTHHINKVLDWLGIEFATYWARYTFTLQELQNQLLQDILKELRDGKKDKS